MDSANPLIVQYINAVPNKTKEEITNNLLLHGWRQEQIDAGFEAAKNQSVKAKTVSYIHIQLWLWPLTYATFFFLVFNIYAFFYVGKFSPLSLSMATAGAAAFTIGFSFALSGLSYYFNFLDKVFASRRYFGLIGYFSALTYSVILLFLDKDRYYYGFFKNITTSDFIFGLSAMTIFTIMALISNNFVLRKLGPKHTHFILRFGYLAYFFLTLRAINMEWPTWSSWASTMQGLPPPRIIVVIFASCVILFRIVLEFSLRRDAKKVKNKSLEIKNNL